MKRITAWGLLLLFVLLLANIFIFRIYMAESVYLYGLMVALFFVTKALKRKEAEGDPQVEGEGGTDDGEEGKEGEEQEPARGERSGDRDEDGKWNEDGGRGGSEDGNGDRDKDGNGAR